jgi:hypothetical protein
MASAQSSEPQWITCPKCRIANLATSVYCSSCGAALDPNAPPPRYPSGASPRQWGLFLGIVGLLIGSAIWAAVSPNGFAAKIYGLSLPFLDCAVLLYGFGRAVLLLRRRDITGGVTGIALTILFALAALPAVLDFNR